MAKGELVHEVRGKREEVRASLREAESEAKNPSQGGFPVFSSIYLFLP